MEECIEVTATWENIHRLISFVDDLELKWSLSHDQAYIVRLVVEEMVTNIVKYGYHADPNGRIIVCCAYEGEVLRITIRDQGQPFDPRDIPDPDLSTDLTTRAIGGLGVFLVRTMCDDLTYRHDTTSGWNELVATKSGRETHV